MLSTVLSSHAGGGAAGMTFLWRDIDQMCINKTTAKLKT
jgi:hypothetical protein